MLLDSLKKRAQTYDVAIAGGGPVGCVTALAFAARGARVLVLEANPQASRRLAGEWIHPPAVAILQRLGVDIFPSRPFLGGRGFVVVPDDGSRPVVLPYNAKSFGYSFEHGALVEKLRGHCEAHPFIEYLPRARVTRVEDHSMTYRLDSGATHTVRPGLVVGATGRTSVSATTTSRATSGTYSRMAGLLVEDAELPFEGYGHVFLGGPGPILAYRIDDRSIRLQMDVPLSLRLRRDRQAALYEAYAPALPERILPAFRRALAGNITWATNQIKPRTNFGRDGVANVGDAVGYHHPLTAVGMTLGFQDGVALAEARSFRAYRRERSLKSRVPELLAVALYEVFADTSDETVEMRKAIYDLWRNDPTERFRTMRFLGCQETSPLAFGSSFLKAMLLAGKSLGSRAMKTGRWDHAAEVTSELAMRVRWLIGGALHLTAANPTSATASAARPSETESAEAEFTRALRASSAKADIVEHP
jgi:2-polyprenyl-6-methoxyphenol hydroxylase-like FAD-dependent oxidoreductase